MCLRLVIISKEVYLGPYLEYDSPIRAVVGQSYRKAQAKLDFIRYLQCKTRSKYCLCLFTIG